MKLRMEEVRLEVRERMGDRKRDLKAKSGIWPSVAGKEEPLRHLEETGDPYSHLRMLWR